MSDRFNAIVYASLLAILGYSAGALFIVAGEPVGLGISFGLVMTVAALFVLVYPEGVRLVRWLQNKRMGERL